MRCESSGNVVRVVLSRRNLQALLAKLDGSPEDSARTIYKDTDIGVVFVTAEEDVEHYRGVRPGVMHPDTESRIKSPDGDA